MNHRTKIRIAILIAWCILAGFTVLALSGCAQRTIHIKHQYKTTQESSQDLMACQYEGLKIEASTQNAIAAVMNREAAIKMCLQMRGYYW